MAIHGLDDGCRSRRLIQLQKVVELRIIDPRPAALSSQPPNTLEGDIKGLPRLHIAEALFEVNGLEDSVLLLLDPDLKDTGHVIGIAIDLKGVLFKLFTVDTVKLHRKGARHTRLHKGAR
jgi:hypothetical protein